jgi:predicted CopG family antitoxin
MRDEFDPLHDNPRAGWYQRPLRPSRAKVVELFQDLSEVEIRDIVQGILTNSDFVSSDDFSDVISPILRRKKKRKGKSVFIVRGPTGRKAEEHFMA